MNNLQENIRRILREETELPIFIRRRVTGDDLEWLVNDVKELIDYGESLDTAIYDGTREFIKSRKFPDIYEFGPDADYWESYLRYERPLVDYVKKKLKITDNVNESILREETEGIDSFFNEISEVHAMSDELKQFLKKFIEESNCKRISFSKFKIFVLGLALDSGVLINSIALNKPLPFLLFLIFHEIAHQYQFKKYGVDIMYDCYLGEVSEMDAAKFMKHTEEVADDFAYRKIRELEKLKLIEPYTPPQMYKTLPIQNIVAMINNYKNDMRGKNIDSPKKISEYFYNMVKGEL